jgi:hypothetical protein
VREAERSTRTLKPGLGRTEPRTQGSNAQSEEARSIRAARRRTTLLRTLCDAGRLTEAEGGLPPGQVDLAGFARRCRALAGHHRPSMLAAADPAEWRQALWATALARLAMLGAIDIPARMSPRRPVGPGQPSQLPAGP